MSRSSELLGTLDPQSPHTRGRPGELQNPEKRTQSPWTRGRLTIGRLRVWCVSAGPELPGLEPAVALDPHAPLPARAPGDLGYLKRGL